MNDLFDRSRCIRCLQTAGSQGCGDRFAGAEIPNDISALSATTVL